jgi:hypothetical protein
MSPTQTIHPLGDLSSHDDSQAHLNTGKASLATQQQSDLTELEAFEQLPPAPDAAEPIPDGGYGWTVIASCSFLLF